jgi:spore coat polysaccharide biosynthesis predicted glycosyltransferase SpsG
MKIVFRCDASSDIGLGHLIRCLTVAKELQSQYQIIFATTKDDTNLYIKNNNFLIFLKAKDESEEVFLERIKSILKLDTIVLDKKYTYNIDCLKGFKQNNIRTVMFDNICPGLSECDEIIFPNAHLDKNILRKYLSPKQINQVKAGPKYVILRDEILALKDKINHNLHNPPNIMVTTGGTDPEGVLLKLIPWLKEMKLKANIFILIGQAFKYKDELKKTIINIPDNFQVLPYSLEEFLEADIVICTFGVSIYEMIYLQIPTICISHSKENAQGAKILKEKYKAIEDLGCFRDITLNTLYNTIARLLQDEKYYKSFTLECENLFDNKGAYRVGQVIIGGKYA